MLIGAETRLQHLPMAKAGHGLEGIFSTEDQVHSRQSFPKLFVLNGPKPLIEEIDPIQTIKREMLCQVLFAGPTSFLFISAEGQDGKVAVKTYTENLCDELLVVTSFSHLNHRCMANHVRVGEQPSVASQSVPVSSGHFKNVTYRHMVGKCCQVVKINLSSGQTWASYG